MDFRIADTFTDSLVRLTGDEQSAVKTTAFDLQMNPANPGMQFHKLDRAKDKNFWSIRVSRDIRIIVHRTEQSLLLCYVGHHDPAYRWAERRKIERHPTTGSMQVVEIRERILEIEVPKYVETERPAPPKPLLFAEVSKERLLAYGVPAEWLEDVKRAEEDTLFELTDHLPAEAAEAWLNLATGATPPLPVAAGVGEDPFAHPDQLDCDENGVGEACDIADCPIGETACRDRDGNGVLDRCEGNAPPTCVNDCSGNGVCHCGACICESGFIGEDCVPSQSRRLWLGSASSFRPESPRQVVG
jgi:mRNA-degrading endonuclease RelE of RelBE toxin-antitoxin system